MPRRRPAQTTGRAETASRPMAPEGERDPSAARRVSVLEAAHGVFLRYGLKKTSMDDLARAAGLSRQGLYLHFQTKEALFKAAIEHLLQQVQATVRAALAGHRGDMEDRLVAACEAMHGYAFTAGDHRDELFAAATALIRPQIDDLEREFLTMLTETLARDGVAAAWKPAGITARDLAEQLHATSYGLKLTAETLAIYQSRMRTAVKIILHGAQR